MLFNLIDLTKKTIININAKFARKFQNVKCIKFFLITTMKVNIIVLIMRHAKDFLFLNFKYI